ncbi:MAG: glycosyltransferase [Lachnospiraceae bacterium]|nr:glycosyltransferase [Lachnospiraceae bacterium]
MEKFFSIIIVCLDPGQKLGETLNSIKAQNFRDLEVIIKDGGSTDGSLDAISQYDDLDIELVEEKDSGIYDAMNRALVAAKGRYVYFLNCGDRLSDGTVLERTASFIRSFEETEGNKDAVFYGDIFEMTSGSAVMSNPRIDEFACFRNVPCHQACFYKRELILRHPFETQYKVRADYEQFLWCFFEAKAHTAYMGFTVADYEGNGYSESPEGRKLSDKEHAEVLSKYMSEKQIRKYRFLMGLSLAPVRRIAAKSRFFSKTYNAVKRIMYGKKKI